MIDLSVKIVLITGGSRGIGAAAARLFAQAGASVAITYRREEERAREVERTSGKPMLLIKADVRNPSSVNRTVRKVVDTCGTIDVLVNNAGIWKRGEIGRMTEREWDETLDTNLKGTFLFCNAVVPLMKKARSGKIVNIASTAGQRGEAYYSHYAASKGGMIAFTKAIGAELAPFNINVNCVAPGWVDTDMSAPALGNPESREEIRRTIPRGRVATPEDIAGSILFLASPFSDHLVGATVSVNGGGVLV